MKSVPSFTKFSNQVFPFLVLPLLTVCFYWKLAAALQYVWFDHWDMCTLEIPRLAAMARAVHAGEFPLWDPYLWSGLPFAGQVQPGTLYPLNLLLALLPFDGTLSFAALNFYYILVHYQAAVFAYALCRDLQLSPPASVAAGCAFSFGGILGAIPWMDIMNGIVWVPLIVLYLLRTLRGERTRISASCCGLCLGMCWLSGHHEVPLVTSAAVFGFWLAVVVTRSIRERSIQWSLAAGWVSAMGLALLVAAVQLGPAFEFARSSKRWVGAPEALTWAEKVPYSVHALYSLPFRGLSGLFLYSDDPQQGAYLFIGLAGVILALLGVVACRQRYGVLFFAGVTCFGLLYVLGSHTPLQRSLYVVTPWLDKARTPLRAAYLVNIGVAVMLGFGLDYLLRFRRWTLASVAVSMLLWEVSSVPGARFTRFGPGTQTACVNQMISYRDISAFLRTQPQPVRVDADPREVLTNFGDFYGVEALEGFTAAIPTPLLRHEFHTERTQELFAVTHHIGWKAARDNQSELFTGVSGMKVFRNPKSMPRVWVVHHVSVVPTDNELRRLIQDPEFDFHSHAPLFETVPLMETCQTPDDVELLTRTSNTVRIGARLACRGLLVVADSWSPEWVATVDGTPAPLHQPYGVFRGVVLEPGDHVVTMTYRPMSLYIGFMCTIVGLCVFLVQAVRRLP